MKNTKWALEQVASRSPDVAGPSPQMAVQQLVDALLGLNGKGSHQVFGIESSKIEWRGKRRLRNAITDALLAWKGYFGTENDSVSQYEIETLGAQYGIKKLQSGLRPPLQCEPLGTVDGLSSEWATRCQALKEVVDGKRKLDIDAVHLIYDEEEGVGRVDIGRTDNQDLYEFALRYENTFDQAFPRELAAMWTAANGISLDGDPYFLSPVEEWQWDDEGLRIGCGHYVQGRLIISGEPDKLLEGKVVDMDDDGVVEVEYENIGTFFDALLGLPARNPGPSGCCQS